ncbi:MAG: transposase [Nitrospira sp.]|nr:transposase [Nitrospira sp.]
MLRREDFMMIHAWAKRGLYLCDIAKQVGVHPRTIRRALARGGAPAARASRRGSRLDRYRADIDRLLAEDVWNAVVIFRELQAKGYTGRLSILRDYIRPKRALRVRRATVRFETAPGRQLQSDWADHRTRIAGREITVHVIVNTLGSRGGSISGARTARMRSIPMKG